MNSDKFQIHVGEIDAQGNHRITVQHDDVDGEFTKSCYLRSPEDRSHFAKECALYFGLDPADLGWAERKLVERAYPSETEALTSDTEATPYGEGPNATQDGTVANPRFNSCPIEGERARIEFDPIPASQLAANGEEVDWLWEGYVARGFITLLTGIWKGGKSTLISHLIREMESGGELAGDVEPAKVLVITEEAEVLWARRRDDLGFGNHASFDVRPFKTRPSYKDWETYVEKVAEAVERGDFDLVIIDPLQSVNPCPVENDSAPMMRALMPLRQIADSGAGVLILHHPRKGDTHPGQASRGSGALLGFVDISLEFTKYLPGNSQDRRRKLIGEGRLEETPREVIIELTETGYKVVGSTGNAKQNDRQEVIEQLLSDGMPRTVEEVRDQWPQKTIPTPGKRTIGKDLNEGYEAGKWEREGKGAKGDPHRYKFDSRTLPPLSTGMESECDPHDDWGVV